MGDPVELVEMRAQIAAARQRYEASVRADLEQLLVLSERFGLAIGEISAGQALEAWQRSVLAYFTRRQ